MDVRDVGPEFMARLERARDAANTGRLEEAEAAFVALLAESRGSGDERERAACDSLFNIYFRARRYPETILLGRHLRGLCGDREDDPRRWAYTLRILATTWLEEGSLSEARELLEEMDAVLLLPHEGPRHQLERLRDDTWLVFAMKSGDIATARARLDARNATLADRPPIQGELAFLKGTEAELLRREGHARQSLEALDEAERLAGDLPWLRIVGLVDRAETFGQLGDVTAVARAVTEAAEYMRAPDMLAQVPQLVVESCARLDGCLDEERDPPSLLDDVRLLAARAVLARMDELDRCLHQVPELLRPNPEDLQLLKRIRSRTLKWSPALSRRVGQLYLERRDAGDDLPVAAGGDEGNLVRVCAWCDRAAGSVGDWLPIGEYLVGDGALRVTHGMCEDCVPTFGRALGE